jgi:hypothetical protein
LMYRHHSYYSMVPLNAANKKNENYKHLKNVGKYVVLQASPFSSLERKVVLPS